jgi:hypothetical protein
MVREANRQADSGKLGPACQININESSPFRLDSFSTGQSKIYCCKAHLRNTTLMIDSMNKAELLESAILIAL